MATASLIDIDEVYAEVLNTASKHPRVKLFCFLNSSVYDIFYRCDRDKFNASITILDCNNQVIKVNGLKVFNNRRHFCHS